MLKNNFFKGHQGNVPIIICFAINALCNWFQIGTVFDNKIANNLFCFRL